MVAYSRSARRSLKTASDSVEKLRRVLRDTLNRIKQRDRIDAADRDSTRTGRAVAALDRGELEAGRRALLQSLKYESDGFETMVDVAAELAFAGFVADAEHVLRRALERFPHRVEAKVELARLFLESGNDEKALRLATQAPARAPTQ